VSRIPAGLVLAAGEGRRFGGPKAPYELDGERLVDRAVRCLREGGCHPVAVVLGAWVGDVPDATVVINEDWSEGMGSSLRAGLAALRGQDAERDVVVSLVDLPGLTPEAVRRIVETDAPLVIATFEGRRGHPVRMGATHLPAIIESAHGDHGARDYLRDRDDIVFVEIGDIAGGEDLDVPAGVG
jgi:CTP:molybdopterin cytidylyltransferase MocA